MKYSEFNTREPKGQAMKSQGPEIIAQWCSSAGKIQEWLRRTHCSQQLLSEKEELEGLSEVLEVESDR
jgi:hypothetical protein